MSSFEEFHRINIALTLQMRKWHTHRNEIDLKHLWRAGCVLRIQGMRESFLWPVGHRVMIISTWKGVHREDLPKFFNSSDSVSQTLGF